ncbi:MAG TPA: 2-hydroxychromene-2-carboxylate isomerase [Polyangia bacterium]|jgi:2-hydroxychromene-2-carboxylate isomerase|nr:2-hydroxychromene-2-carboxylate isomerase [Polyangia bacterium]
MTRFTFYYDIVCPYAYLASTQVEALAARAGAEIVWEPILLGGVFRAIGQSDQPARAAPAAKVALGLLDMQRYAALYGVPLKLHPRHPLRSVEAMRLLHTVAGAEQVALMHRLYRAHFVENRDISDRAVLADYGEVVRIDDPAVKAALHAATDRAVADGVFGVPAFIVEQAGQRRLFWGQDRMLLVEKALGGWQVPA